jgi:hypothetical protein
MEKVGKSRIFIDIFQHSYIRSNRPNMEHIIVIREYKVFNVYLQNVCEIATLSAKTGCFVFHSFTPCVQNHQEENFCDRCGSKNGFHHPKENPETRLKYLTLNEACIKLGQNLIF